MARFAYWGLLILLFASYAPAQSDRRAAKFATAQTSMAVGQQSWVGVDENNAILALIGARDALSQPGLHGPNLPKASGDVDKALLLLEDREPSREAVEVALSLVRESNEAALQLTVSSDAAAGYVATNEATDRIAAAIRSLGGALAFFPRNGQPAPAGQAVVKVFYATDRKLSSANALQFSAEEGAEKLSFGIFSVSIPRDHRLAEVERPSIWDIRDIDVVHLRLREDPSRHFIIVSRDALSENAFYPEVSRTVNKCPERQAFVFIHGFAVTFDDAVYRTAQLAYDLGFCGAPILYSWPASFDYPVAVDRNEWTVEHLKSFLEQVSSQSGATTVHLIAHSMGNRALVNALSRLQKTSDPQFRHIVLNAADINARTFARLAAAVRSHAQRVTLYVSSNDKALKASKSFNGEPRAGDSSGDPSVPVVLDGVDTIDVSAVDTDFIGHFYYGSNRSVLSDLFQLLRTGDPPSRRFGLQSVGAPPKTYWKFVPSKTD